MSAALTTAWEAFLATSPGDYPATQRECLAELVAATAHDFVGELLDDLRRDGAAHVATLAAAATAGDGETAARAAHTLKSMGRALGFERLGALCVRVEEAVRDAALERTPPLAVAIRRELELVDRLRAAWG